jgi:hypothetical protein
MATTPTADRHQQGSSTCLRPLMKLQLSGYPAQKGI